VNAAVDSGLTAAGDLDMVVHDFHPTGPVYGRSVYLQGQLHSNESAALLVLQDLVSRLRKNPPGGGGRVRVVPNANPIGWSRYLASGQGRISANGTNWNRMFVDPDRQSGSIDDVLARTLWRLSESFDVVIDVHTPEFGWAHLYAPSADRRLLSMDDVPHVLYGDPTIGPFDECHLRLRDESPAAVWSSVTLEIPSHEIPTPDLISHWSGRLYREIEAQSRSAERIGLPEISGTMTDLVPAISGAVVMLCRPGEVLKAGEPVLAVHGRKGDVEIVSAPADCVPVCFRRAAVVEAGYWVCRAIALS